MEGHNVWPLKLVTELFKLANDSEVLDLHLHTHTPVLSIKPYSASRLHSRVSALPRRWALTTPRGRTACAHVVTAANAYTPALLPALRGEDGIVPTRAQITTTRAAVPARNLTKSSWSSENEYWFPRPLLGEGEKSRDRPLVIIGGARLESATAERYTVDDSEVNELVGKELRAYLPRTFPGLYKEGQEPEMEWVRRMRIPLGERMLMSLPDGYHGVHQTRRSFRELHRTSFPLRAHQ
jgi:glycine/D-amino acid oxidase-like deaminating enzyme